MLPLYKDGPGRNDVRIAHTFNGLTINDPADDPTDTIELNAVSPATTFRTVIDQHQNREGSEAGIARRSSRVYRATGMIRSPSIARLMDRIAEMAAAFDPDKASRESPDTQGFLPYDFSVPTTDEATYPSGLVPSRIYVRSLRVPEPTIRYDQGHVAHFSYDLFQRDPRRYLQAESTFGLASGTADNGKANYRSWPSVVLTMTGAGNQTCTLTNSTVGNSLVLDLSTTQAGDEVVIDMEQKFITLNWTDTMSLYGSGDYWWMEPGDNDLAITNATNISGWLVSWRPAFVL